MSPILQTSTTELRPQFYYEHWVQHRGQDVLVYEGRSVNPGQRTGAHSREKPYWALGVRIEVKVFRQGTTDDDVKRFELESIDKRRAPWNDVGNPDFDMLAWKRAEILREPTTIPLVVNRAHYAAVKVARATTIGAGLGLAWAVGYGSHAVIGS